MFGFSRILYLLTATILTSGNAFAEQNKFTSNEAFFTAPQDGGLRRWQVNEGPMLDMVSAPNGSDAQGDLLSAGAIVTNFGCADSEGEMWCQVRLLHGGSNGFVSADRLIPVAGPDGIVARGINDSAKRAKRKKFDATAEILCAQEKDELLAACPIGVARSDGGDATAAITFKNGFVRFLFFMHGEFISGSATMSGAGRDTDWVVQEGVHVIRVDDQQFEIPNSVLFNVD